MLINFRAIYSAKVVKDDRRISGTAGDDPCSRIQLWYERPRDKRRKVGWSDYAKSIATLHDHGKFGGLGCVYFKAADKVWHNGSLSVFAFDAVLVRGVPVSQRIALAVPFCASNRVELAQASGRTQAHGCDAVDGKARGQ